MPLPGRIGMRRVFLGTRSHGERRTRVDANKNQNRQRDGMLREDISNDIVRLVVP